MRYNFSGNHLRSGLRTAGALMIGVGVFIFDKPVMTLWGLLTLGFLMIVVTSFTRPDSPGEQS